MNRELMKAQGCNTLAEIKHSILTHKREPNSYKVPGSVLKSNKLTHFHILVSAEGQHETMNLIQLGAL